MAADAQIGMTTIIIAGIVLVLFVMMLKLAYDIKRLVNRNTAIAEEKASNVEDEMNEVKKEILLLNTMLLKKADGNTVKEKVETALRVATRKA